jgi:hypothetical protein
VIMSTMLRMAPGVRPKGLVTGAMLGLCMEPK